MFCLQKQSKNTVPRVSIINRPVYIHISVNVLKNKLLMQFKESIMIEFFSVYCTFPKRVNAF